MAPTVAEYWNSETDDSVSYLDMLYDPSFPPTAGGEFTSPFGDDFTNHTFDATNPTDSDLSNIPENVDMSWASYNASLSSTTSAPTYNFDHTPAASQGYSFGNVDVNPKKRLRISNLTEENILPDNQRRKRTKPDKLSL